MSETPQKRDRSPKLARILWMVNVMLSRGYLTRAMAAKEIGITHRTFFRYLGSLRDAGFMIDHEGSGIFRLRAMQPQDKALDICLGRAKLIGEADLNEVEPPISPDVHHVRAGSVRKAILAKAGGASPNRYSNLDQRRAAA